ncbi:hypothetical protein LOTGIDRAFT_235312 [Lottia gigantea]|uniref:Glycine N-acyltransferase-like protein n=1 Tax=Lottia gigantea TaxID=225164 RepID=V3ZV79_LOTGI|nr:hypothetical protein LOTGIDRAFT_235312 [Lottia gigantea]ESO86485.1 hypothetical protein LOTGIDRAFT_235312 [Lottia gigantea]
MIYQVITKTEVDQLTDELKIEFPGSAKIFYVLRNYLLGLMEGFEVIVDNWPEWTCIILKPGSDQEVPGYFEHFYICYAKSVASLKFFIQRPGVIDWKKPATFTGVPYDILPVIHEVCRKHGGHLPYIEPRFMYCWTTKPPEMPKIPEGIKLTTLFPEHAEQLQCDWKNVRGGSDLDIYFRRVIKNFDSSALINEQGELLAYICMQFNGSMAMLHVNKNHRGYGYGEILLKAMTHKLTSNKEVAYGFIPTKDDLGIKKAQVLGYTWIPQGNMVWVKYLPTPKPQKAIDTSDESSDLALSDDEEPNIFINAIPLAVNKKSHKPNCFTSYVKLT